MELFKKTNFDFLGKKWPFIIMSLVLSAVGVGSLIVHAFRTGPSQGARVALPWNFLGYVSEYGPRYGIDFKGGALVTVRFLPRPPVEKVRAALGNLTVEVQEINEKPYLDDVIGAEVHGDKGVEGVNTTIVENLNKTFGQPGSGKLDINNSGPATLVERLRTPLLQGGVNLNELQLGALAKAIYDYKDSPARNPDHSGLIASIDDLKAVQGVTPQVVNVIKQECYASAFTVRSADVVGPRVGAELRSKAILAVLYALGGMLIYIAFRFEWIYGFAAVIAVFHDTIITIGLFSLFNKEISLTVVAALLTLVGYSMNDTIVVFDRIRENLKLLRREPLESVINKSVNQTLSRTVLTSGLTFLTAISLFLFGGQVLSGFSFALVVGILVGTYSSVFVASPILVFWQDYREGRKRRKPASVPVATARKGSVGKGPLGKGDVGPGPGRPTKAGTQRT
jgi:preprotein translocase subunit SecF